jgi:hypothetical protein
MIQFVATLAVVSVFIYVLSFALESVIFSRFFDTPFWGIIVSTAAGALLCMPILRFTAASPAEHGATQFVYLFLGGSIVALGRLLSWRRREARAARSED